MYGEERIYKKVEVIGVSRTGIEDAIQRAVSKARESLDGLSWFEVGDIRGHIDDKGKVNEYQVVLKLAFIVQ
ncbi:MAG: dodecin [Desulfuromonadales bacterium]|jgi:flavin-binding protein dodecin